ncbi:MAG TPA: hypothetical protein VFX16_23915 [Pseudonocardiaceae bacterium]|nr:hypothetical protein [Pseudonocardiaceae bacterium]
MGQLSFYSAEASAPRLADLAGVLCGPGQATGFGAGTAARLTVPVDQRWRAVALVAACAERGVGATVSTTEDGRRVVRTAFRADLVGLASHWQAGATKSVPERFVMDGVTLRLWALVAGRWSESGYLLGLDPDSPWTHLPLVTALVRAGMSLALVDDGGPALRVAGARRLGRLVELVGVPPPGVPGHDWPAVAGNRGANAAVRVKNAVDGVT